MRKFMPLACAMALAGCSVAPEPLTAATGRPVLASWYGSESGSHTANGERFNPAGMTAAHRSLPFGTLVRVTVAATGRTAVVRINDRGPAKWTGRSIDLAHGAARKLGVGGVAPVYLAIVGRGK